MASRRQSSLTDVPERLLRRVCGVGRALFADAEEGTWLEWLNDCWAHVKVIPLHTGGLV
jgi:hypothetical protein